MARVLGQYDPTVTPSPVLISALLFLSLPAVTVAEPLRITCADGSPEALIRVHERELMASIRASRGQGARPA
jgi:hypothetical protein